MTSKRFTVVLGCCDPPTPVLLSNTNNLTRARFLFNQFKGEEIREGGGGEFDLTLYEHTEESRPEVFKAEGEGGAFIHTVIFKGSKELDSFNYMDLAGMKSDEGTAHA